MSIYTNAVTIAKFQAYLKDLGGDITYVAELQEKLDAATDYVYNLCRWNFGASALTETFYGNSFRSHRLTGRGFTGVITSVTVYDSTNATVSGFSTSDFFVDNGNLFSKTNNFYPGYRYVFVLAISQVVPDVVQLVVQEVGYDMLEKSRRGTGSLGKQTDFSNVLGQSSLQYSPDAEIYKRWMRMLSPYIFLG